MISWEAPEFWLGFISVQAMLLAMILAVELCEWASYWDEWRGSLDGRPTMWIKRLGKIPCRRHGGRWLYARLDLHMFVRADDEQCFHTHPSHALRWVLWGGYIEEVVGLLRTTGETISGKLLCAPGHLGHVTPEHCHRIDEILNGRRSLSLWLRGPIVAEIELVGRGWPIGAKPHPTAGKP